VEAILLRHSDVANCGVVGLGEPGKQIVVAAVTLKNPADANPATEGAILKLAASGLPANECPARVVFVDELPTVLGGAEVQREVLQKQLAARQ
jgi:acyl-coenzyme A synthetase/AMP-(fatty) acid ligase